jgi:hypothetical protein
VSLGIPPAAVTGSAAKRAVFVGKRRGAAGWRRSTPTFGPAGKEAHARQEPFGAQRRTHDRYFDLFGETERRRFHPEGPSVGCVSPNDRALNREAVHTATDSSAVGQ